jgi:hypothetical protein
MTENSNHCHPSEPNTFISWNEILKKGRDGLDTVFVDLDIIDQNIAVVKSMLGEQFKPRIVTKGLPCLSLIQYVSKEFDTKKLMTFSEGTLIACVKFFNKFDILQGRPLPLSSVKRVLHAIGHHNFQEITWLVDTVSLARDLASLNLPLKVAIELECGVMRGGPRTTDELIEILDVISDSKLKFSGFMGYDGHVIFAPLTATIPGAPIVLTSDEEFANVNVKYQAFIDASKAKYPDWFNDDTMFNGGGSVTLNYYTGQYTTPVNDVAFGIAILSPSLYDQVLSAFGIKPALYCTSYVSKRIDNAELQFEPGYLPALAQDNPALQTCFYVNSGSFPADRVYPSSDDGLIDNPFSPDTSGYHQFANLTQYYGPSALPLNIGDNVFYRPLEGSAVAWLGNLVAIRGNHIVKTWDTITEQP